MSRVAAVVAARALLSVSAAFWFQISEVSATDLSTGAVERWSPSYASIAKIESDLRLPRGARPLNEYTRYYSPDAKRGRHAVIGVLVAGGDRAIHIVSHSDLPQILDGGCGVIDLFYDMDNAESMQISCNGNA